VTSVSPRAGVSPADHAGSLTPLPMNRTDPSAKAALMPDGVMLWAFRQWASVAGHPPTDYSSLPAQDFGPAVGLFRSTIATQSLRLPSSITLYSVTHGFTIECKW
jgi:hypothetical protein